MCHFPVFATAQLGPGDELPDRGQHLLSQRLGSGWGGLQGTGTNSACLSAAPGEFCKRRKKVLIFFFDKLWWRQIKATAAPMAKLFVETSKVPWKETYCCVICIALMATKLGAKKE